jgi:predicted transcriptional regulator
MAETRINIRASEELKRMVGELAKADNRTVTNYLETLIKREYDVRITGHEKIKG